MLWQTQWASLYPPASLSHQIIKQIQNTYYLVNLVDNDFVQGNVLFEVQYYVQYTMYNTLCTIHPIIDIMFKITCIYTCIVYLVLANMCLLLFTAKGVVILS